MLDGQKRKGVMLPEPCELETEESDDADSSGWAAQAFRRTC